MSCFIIMKHHTGQLSTDLMGRSCAWAGTAQTLGPNNVTSTSTSTRWQRSYPDILASFSYNGRKYDACGPLSFMPKIKTDT